MNNQPNVGFYCPQCGAMRGVMSGSMIGTREGRKFITDGVKDGQVMRTCTDDEVRASRWNCACTVTPVQPSLFDTVTVTT